jgi:hypothetical protein
MRCFIRIVLGVLLIAGGGCQTISNQVSRSASRAADDYNRVTTGGKSSYISSGGKQF